MALSDEPQKEMTAYQKGPFEDLTIQDAIIIIAIYAAQIDPEQCEADVRRIESLAERHSEFVEKKADIFARIHKFINSMQTIDPRKAVEIAADALTPELRKTAFELAVQVALTEKFLTEEKKAIFDTLKDKLSVESQFARQTLEKFTI